MLDRKASQLINILLEQQINFELFLSATDTTYNIDYTNLQTYTMSISMSCLEGILAKLYIERRIYSIF